ncbi:hypothetical protein BH11PLA2_BH11PLA2_30210 [soil metagenome]
MLRLLLIPVTLLSVSTARAADAFDLLKYIPPQANTVAVINVANLLASPRAEKEGWSKLEHTEYLAGAVPLNPLVERLILAKEMQPGDLAGGSVLALRSSVAPIKMEKVAQLTGGTATTVSDEQAVVTKSGTYYIKLADQVLGSLRPDNKQDVGRWLRFAKSSKESALNKSLNAAVARSTNNHITIAVDVEDMFDDALAVAVVAATKSIQTDPAQVKLVEKFVVGLKAIVFTANIKTDGITAVIRLESKSVDAKLDPEFVKAFAMETLGHSGAMLEDLGTAKSERTDGSVALTFLMSDPELAKVMSLVIPNGMLPVDGAKIEVAPAGATVAATVKYFNAVNAIVDDLVKKNKNADDYFKTALWHDTAATKIETMSVLNVDKAVVEYAHGTATILRGIADSLNGVPAKVNELQSQAYAFSGGRNNLRLGRGGVRFNPWGYGNNGGVQTNLGDIRNKQTAAIKEDKVSRDKLWATVEGKRSETRAAIAAKFNVVVPEKK